MFPRDGKLLPVERIFEELEQNENPFPQARIKDLL